jgi:hypothetical protein
VGRRREGGGREANMLFHIIDINGLEVQIILLSW